MYALTTVQEREGTSGAVVQINPAVDDEGYVSPELELPSEMDDLDRPPMKKSKHAGRSIADDGLEDEEELALRLLNRR